MDAERGRAVMGGLAGAEQVQVRAIEQQQARHGRCRSSFRFERCFAAGSEPDAKCAGMYFNPRQLEYFRCAIGDVCR